MKPVILFRSDQMTEEEYEIASSVWGSACYRYRSDIPKGSLVLGRYSTLPYYAELDRELLDHGSRLVNVTHEYQQVADMQNWYRLLEGKTPRSWFQTGYAQVPECAGGYVVKGATNSRKHQWATHMFAQTRQDLRGVVERLYDDPLISTQGLVIREYVPLMPVTDEKGQPEISLNGLPFSNEWRVFFIKKPGTHDRPTLLASGFYWSEAECADAYTELPEEARALAQEAADVMGDYLNAFVIDVGQRLDGGWTVIECNCFSMAGLSCIDPEVFYGRLRELTRTWEE